MEIDSLPDLKARSLKSVWLGWNQGVNVSKATVPAEALGKNLLLVT